MHAAREMRWGALCPFCWKRDIPTPKHLCDYQELWSHGGSPVNQTFLNLVPTSEEPWYACQKRDEMLKTGYTHTAHLRREGGGERVFSYNELPNLLFSTPLSSLSLHPWDHWKTTNEKDGGDDLCVFSAISSSFFVCKGQMTGTTPTNCWMRVYWLDNLKNFANSLATCLWPLFTLDEAATALFPCLDRL